MLNKNILECHVKRFEDSIRLYQKTDQTDFDKLQVTNSIKKEGIDSQVMSESSR